jgi:hypothetical protein
MPETTKRTRARSGAALNLSAKDRVSHTVFGLGTIVSSNEWHTTIAFDEAGTRKFVTNLVKLAPSDTPAPARRVTRKKAKARSKAKS